MCNRGAEQGDPLGPVFCAVVLAKVIDATKDRLESANIFFKDVWYMDDGQVLCHPRHADQVVRVFDEEAAKVGAKRGVGADAKTVCRLIGSLARKT